MSTAQAPSGFDQKVARLLTSGAVTVEYAVDRILRFRVVGTHDTYVVVRQPGSWSCTCPRLGRCSHMSAAMKVAP